MDYSSPGCRPCCSHPHGKTCNITAASLAIPALGLSLTLCVFYWGFAYHIDEYWVAAFSLGTAAPLFGLVAMVVSFTATCRAYRRCGIMAIACLYGLSFVTQTSALVVLRSADCQYGSGYSYYYTSYCYRGLFVGLTIPASLLWFACTICAALVPRYEDVPMSSTVQPGQIVGSAARGADNREIEVEEVVEVIEPDGTKVTTKTITHPNGSKSVTTTTSSVPVATAPAAISSGSMKGVDQV